MKAILVRIGIDQVYGRWNAPVDPEYHFVYVPIPDELEIGKDSVFMVVLRQPQKNDQRSDPFWEFGSFGVTKCHAKNSISFKNASCLEGGRLAFAQDNFRCADAHGLGSSQVHSAREATLLRKKSVTKS